MTWLVILLLSRDLPHDTPETEWRASLLRAEQQDIERREVIEAEKRWRAWWSMPAWKRARVEAAAKGDEG